MSGSLTISYGSDSVAFTDFSGDELPSSILGQASLEFSQIGLGYSTGPARTQRRIWAVATYATSAQIATLNTIFTAWDTARSTSLNTAVVNVVDNLLREKTGNTSIPTVTTTAFFTTPPTVSLVGRSNEIYLLSFGLTEV
jgi:hypothetical protein